MTPSRPSVRRLAGTAAVVLAAALLAILGLGSVCALPAFPSASAGLGAASASASEPDADPADGTPASSQSPAAGPGGSSLMGRLAPFFVELRPEPVPPPSRFQRLDAGPGLPVRSLAGLTGRPEGSAASVRRHPGAGLLSLALQVARLTAG